MSTLRALKPLAGVTGLGAAALLALWLLVSNDVTFAVVPPPETEAESLMRALKARRFSAVKSELVESLREQVDDSRLDGLFRRIEEARKGISDAHGDKAREDGDRATAMVKVKLDDKTEETLEFPLQKEHGLWRVSSIDALEALGRLAR